MGPGGQEGTLRWESKAWQEETVQLWVGSWRGPGGGKGRTPVEEGEGDILHAARQAMGRKEEVRGGSDAGDSAFRGQERV